jgi:hypothetical protein
LLAPVVTEEDAKKFAEQMAKPDLYFLTEANEKIVRARLTPEVRAQIDKEQKEFDERQERAKKTLEMIKEKELKNVTPNPEPEPA